MARKRYGKLNTVVMNAVLEACVHCGDVDAALKVFEGMVRVEKCGVDGITYGILLKVQLFLFIFSSYFWFFLVDSAIRRE